MRLPSHSHAQPDCIPVSPQLPADNSCFPLLRLLQSDVSQPVCAHLTLSMAAGGRTPEQRRVEVAAMLRNVPRRRRGSCKCLFGVPDRDETRRLVSEQYSRDRKRFIRRFNFDVETESAYKAAKLDSPVKFSEGDEEKLDSPRSAAQALSSVGNTDLRLLESPSRRSIGSGNSSPRTPRTPRAARTPRTPRTPASRRQLQMTGPYHLKLFYCSCLSY